MQSNEKSLSTRQSFHYGSLGFPLSQMSQNRLNAEVELIQNKQNLEFALG